MSASISFSNIKSNTRVPLFHVEFDNSQANPGQQNPRRLIIGITLVSQPQTPVLVPSVFDANLMFGQLSPLAMSIAAYKAVDPVGEVWAYPVFAPPTGQSASGGFTINGTAGNAGTIVFYIAGQPVPVPVTQGMTGAQIGSALVSNYQSLGVGAKVPATLSIVTGTAITNAFGPNEALVGVTASAAGVWGNGIDLRINYKGVSNGESIPNNISIAVTPMNGGTLAPDLSTLAANLAGMPFQHILNPFSDTGSLAATTALMSNQSGRWSDSQQLYGHVWAGAVAPLTSLVSLGEALNDPHLTLAGIANTPTPPWVFAADYMGACSPALDDDPGRPVFGLQLASTLAPPPTSVFKSSDLETLLGNGIATCTTDATGATRAQRAITTYEFNTSGAPDQSYLDSQTLFLLMAVTTNLKAAVTSQFARVKIADDGTPIGDGSAIVTPSAIKNVLVAEYQTMILLGWVERADLFAQGLIVQRNLLDPTRVDILYDPYLVSPLNIFAVLNQFRLGQ